MCSKFEFLSWWLPLFLPKMVSVCPYDFPWQWEEESLGLMLVFCWFLPWGGCSNSWVNPAQVCFVESCFWAWAWNLLLKSAAKEFKIYLWRDMDSFQSIFVVLWNSLRLALCLTRVVLDKFLYFWINHNFLVILPVRSHI